ncbi:MAG: VOC family protein [Alphaproteobacteria bacterium]
MATEMTGKKFDVGGVLLERPFKIRRLGHFGINVIDMEKGKRFYKDLLGFRIVDIRDPLGGKPVPDEMKEFGDHNGYFFRYQSDHHAFVLYNHRVRGAMDRLGRWRKDVNVNQITWQVQSLEEVVGADKWLTENGNNMVRRGRDMPGSNWHTYLMDPDWFQNELFYGIEQIGWDGYSKPNSMHKGGYHEFPELPHRSEYAEINEAIAQGMDPREGYRHTESLPEKYDVQGILLARPFKITRIGPVRLFCSDVEASLKFYRDMLGFIVTEEIVYKGHRCVFLRNNTEHHSMALYPIELRKEIGLSENSKLMSFGVQVANYKQLRDAKAFLQEQGVQIKELPGELYPGIDYSFFALDGDGQAIQFYYSMEQIGWDGKPRPASQRRPVKPGVWPETVEGLSDTYAGETLLGPWN